MKPLFKWTGGKGRLLQKYTDFQFFPEDNQFDTFVDLFFGGGAVTCWVAEMYPDKNLIINDINEEMMNMMFQMRNNWKEFKDYYLKAVETFLTAEDRKKNYFDHRDLHHWQYKDMPEAQIAANLLCMMKTNFNGIWLAYKSFNYRYSTAFGKDNYKASLFDINKVEEFRDILLRAKVLNGSYNEVDIPDRSWVYADPPYRDTRKMYSKLFSDEQQNDLSKFIQDKGLLYAESNKEIGDGFWEKRFPKEHIHYLDHKYTCGWGGGGNAVTEVLIKNYGLEERNPLAALF